MLWLLFLANLKMVFRNRQALLWALFFPLVFVVVFGVFRFDRPTPVNMAVVDHAGDEVSQQLLQGLQTIESLKLDTKRSEEEARRALADGDIGYVLVIPAGLAQGVGGAGAVTLTLLVDEAQGPQNQMVRSIVERFIDSMNLAVQGGQRLLGMEMQGVNARRVGYFDFLLPGFIGMGVMNYAIIGMATVIALYRQQKILKRIRATPLRVTTFFSAQVLAYLVLSLVQAAIILMAGLFLFDAKVYGNILWLFPLVILANLTFLNLGFIAGSIARSVEAASGLGNVVAIPMMFFSGVFFPTDTLPTALRVVVQYLPLTPLLDALRGVMLEARPLWEFPVALGLLGAWVVVSGVLAVRIFRFD
ncbi:MAG: ABC transporter permease [Chloroflexi bacterium]|nr:ABC transporter permease [Chloroflexota bacterium]